jgi:hypothetical protein
MAEINLKTLTPDTSLPTTGFLFGADSQASTNPSVYSTQTVATTLLGSTSLTGDTLTASAPVLNLTQTWNNAAVTFTAMKLNVTDTLSNAASLLMDVGTGGGSFASKFKIDGGGRVTIASVASGNSLTIGNTNVNTDGTILRVYDAEINGNGGGIIAAGGANGIFRIGGDTVLSRKAVRNFQLGAADAATALAQTLSVQSVVAGTTNGAGAAFTINGSQGTGTGAGGSIVFQVAPAGGSGNAQNAFNTILELATALSGQSTEKVVIDRNGNGPMIYGTNIGIGSSINAYNIYCPSNGSISIGGTDAFIFRDAANTLALKNGTNAQELRVYENATGSIYKAILGNRQLIKISGASFDNGAGASAGTMTNAPAAGNPTKWIPIDDNGTTRYIPAW